MRSRRAQFNKLHFTRMARVRAQAGKTRTAMHHYRRGEPRKYAHTLSARICVCSGDIYSFFIVFRCQPCRINNERIYEFVNFKYSWKM